ncbi:ATP-binding protein, partial [Solihabitans fulvus]
MSHSDHDTSDEEQTGPIPRIHLSAHASGDAQVNQAGRDQHFHYVDGAHDQRRTTPGTLVRECPYPGLAAFGPDQAQWFFGRDDLTADLIARLDRRLTTGGLQMVVAPSGAGKSSLLRAGLLPRLGQATLPGSDRWPTVLFTPTADPVRALADQLAHLTGDEPAIMAGLLVSDSTGCVTLLNRVLRDRGSGSQPARVVVVVDQLEELFTQCSDEPQRRTFLSLLEQIAGGPVDLVACRCLVVVAVPGRLWSDRFPSLSDKDYRHG